MNISKLRVISGKLSELLLKTFDTKQKYHTCHVKRNSGKKKICDNCETLRSIQEQLMWINPRIVNISS